MASFRVSKMFNTLVEEPPDQLSLPGLDGVTDMAKTRAHREALRGRPRSEATVRNYSADWKSFVAWCARNGRSYLPASAATLGLYVTWLLKEQNKKVNTAARHLAAIRDSHRRAALPVPSTDDAREVLANVRRQRREQPKRKKALAVEDLVRIAETCDDSTVRGIRDRAIIVLGFATSLRRSDLARVQVRHIEFKPQGCTVFIPFSKTDQDGVGRTIGVRHGTRPSTDPVRVLNAWLAVRGNWEGPLFCAVHNRDVITSKAINGSAIALIIKAAARRAGLDPVHYAGHSLRAGAATAAGLLGRSDQEIMALTGHKTAAMVRVYMRNEALFRGRDPLEGVL